MPKRRKKYPLPRRILRFLKRQFRNPRKRLLAELAAVVVIIGIVIFIALSGQNITTDDIKEGRAYIEGLEATDTASVEEQVKELRKKERKAALESGDLDVWSQFTDIAILGDSRAVGFYSYNLVDESRVFATGGATIRDIEQYTDQLVALNPSSIIFCYGLNDISIGYWDNVDDYIAEQDQIIADLKEAMPNTTIYINSIIPAIDPAFERSEKWRDIPDWNDAIRQHCEDNDIPYIDITEDVEAHSDLYDVDGIHMQKAFYEYWAIDMITEVTENE
ncbi:MAG TPA: hypothetical protein H9747_01305 [Candidatus Blautia stercorigallinarum]|uniref:SGNH hydrolase-type esterase domain-containing protein n=1 Tax=Candidatus Blautia stercorigallinarum TaxID=2838501 RepID=A0A9D1PAY5_9FIRM|nr:hypothetical protein [Candidatus Blautia stercorigallinarum]